MLKNLCPLFVDTFWALPTFCGLFAYFDVYIAFYFWPFLKIFGQMPTFCGFLPTFEN